MQHLHSNLRSVLQTIFSSSCPGYNPVLPEHRSQCCLWAPSAGLLSLAAGISSCASTHASNLGVVTTQGSLLQCIDVMEMVASSTYHRHRSSRFWTAQSSADPGRSLVVVSHQGLGIAKGVNIEVSESEGFNHPCTRTLHAALPGDHARDPSNRGPLPALGVPVRGDARGHAIPAPSSPDQACPSTITHRTFTSTVSRQPSRTMTSPLMTEVVTLPGAHSSSEDSGWCRPPANATLSLVCRGGWLGGKRGKGWRQFSQMQSERMCMALQSAALTDVTPSLTNDSREGMAVGGHPPCRHLLSAMGCCTPPTPQPTHLPPHKVGSVSGRDDAHLPLPA